MSERVLEAISLTKRFGALTVAQDVSLQLARGARHALIGPNGAGKTTLISLLTGLLRPESGRVLLLGSDVTMLSPQQRVRQGLVRTFQVNNLFRGLSVLENVFLAVSERHRASHDVIRPASRRGELIAIAHQMIEKLGLIDDVHRRVSEISYGRQRLVEIAIALSLEPKVLLLDEPAAGIPSGELSRLLEAIERLPLDIAVLMVEHDMQVVRRFAETVTVLVGGSVLISGKPHEVMASHEVRSVYLGRAAYG